ncbi:MAG: prepilin-type N-terminal cleavage/methylation domain-containing protein [Gemmatales bacterium]
MRLSQKHQRHAFTLVELLVVITIIIVILALTIGAIGKSFNWVKQKNTEQTMTRVVERMVQRRLTQIYKDAKEWETPVALYRQAHGDGRRAEALKVLYLYKWSFPETYSEAYYNILESQALYDATNGYPAARGIYLRLRSTVPTVMTDLQFTACPTAADMSRILQRQNSACLLAAFQSMNASSMDEFTNTEVTISSAIDIPPQAVVLADGTNLANGYASQNPTLTDAWGTPFFFLRHGNTWDNFGSPRAAINRDYFWMGLRSPTVCPAAAVLGTSYYDILVNNADPLQALYNKGRAFQTFTSRWNSDPFDPEGAFRNSEAWRAQFPSGGVTWLTGVHLCPAAPGTPQHQDFFRSNFGYRPQPSNLNGPGSPPDRWAQEYAPFVLISAGGDKLFTTWEDNLDSYRLKINLSGQQ